MILPAPSRPTELRRRAATGLSSLVAVTFVVAVLLALGVAAPAHASSSPKRAVLHGNPARALLAYKAMQKSFYVQGSGLYRGEPFSFLWPFSQALAATVSLAYIPGQATQLARDLHARVHGLGAYFGPPAPANAAASGTDQQLRSYTGSVAPPIGPGGASFYDDNEWVGIELARLYKLDHDPLALAQAQQIMAFVIAGWQTMDAHGRALPCPGGVPFSNAPSNNSRNTVTDGPGAELALQLYGITREARYLQFAETAYAWVRSCLLLPGGMYGDHILNNGEIEPTTWSYNQGSMIGAAVMLYEATGNGAYLFQARQTAKAALTYFTLGKLAAENPFFAAVFFRNVLLLDSVTHDPPGRRLPQAYANYAWSSLRTANNLFATGSPPTPELLGQAAVVQIYALLSIAPSAYF